MEVILPVCGDIEIVVDIKFNNTADVGIVAILATFLNAEYNVIERCVVSSWFTKGVETVLSTLSLYHLYFHHVTRGGRHINVATVVR